MRVKVAEHALSRAPSVLRVKAIALLLQSVVCLSTVLAARPANAQLPYVTPEGPRATGSLFVGVRAGGRIALNSSSVDYLGIGSSPNWGFNVGGAIVPNLFGEFMWNRQTTSLNAHHVATNSSVTLTDKAHLDLYQASLLYEFQIRSRLRPFAVAGIGVTHFDSYGILSFDNRFSYNLGGGLKYILAPPVALRAEIRWSPTRTTSSSSVVCDPSFGCIATPIGNHADQLQANIGVEFRF